ncbi:3-hydroxyacyl-CoA dehydrogenase [Glutamicibacter sp. MNS18]|uniref:3-hydroxyacyl-CoA dehydrogenase n=1 Tax=Glutamicibacter sp. MNS18 TaxID=2989817 RepID=UPI002236690B|nr:3-hydroxyacyl-CoA dehydrogenase [Glutamicibacter sp. MNS18]MCW4465827.1 3-hydroxyacyl-CoA dehydrogenase [Glutamicibacter sp. MNS18]
MQIKDAVALVTGGLSGLGRATAQTLAEAGARVVVVDLPHEQGADLAADISQQVHYAPADVTDPAQVQRAVDAAEALGPLRIVVNCAGVATPGKVLGRDGVLPLERFAKVLEINVNGTFNVIRLAAEAMSRTDSLEGLGGTGERGVIINTASVAAFDGQIGQPAYAASKGAVAAMTLPLARELARYQIRVMTIAPGIFHTPMMSGLPQAAQDSLGAQVPHPSRLGQPGEYAALVQHIVQNAMLNGETIRLDGAIRMAPK